MVKRPRTEEAALNTLVDFIPFFVHFRSLSLDPLCGDRCDAFNSQCER